MPLKPASTAGDARTAAPDGRDEQLAALASPDPLVRRQGARALAGDAGAVETLCAQLAREDDVAVWEAILSSLAQTGGNAALEGLLRYLRAEPAQLRNEVLETLKTFPQAQILPHIGALLKHPDPHMRIAVIQMVQALGYPACVDTLNATLAEEEHVNVAATAVDLLAEMGTPEAVPALRTARQRFAGVPYMTFAIDTALARIERGGEK